MQTTRCFFGLVLFGSLLVFSGCGKEEERLEVHPAKGVVHFKGQPMKGGGSINFFPMSKGGRDASGTINEDGTFTLTSYQGGEGAGAAAGQYRVVINQVTMKEGAGSTNGEEGGGESEETVAKADQIPLIYADPLRSPAVQEIKAGDNDLKIELEANPNANRGA